MPRAPHLSYGDGAMAASTTRSSDPTPRSSAIVVQPDLAELLDARTRLAREVARLERHVSMLSTEVAAADQKVADLEKLQLAARGLAACADRAAVLAMFKEILVTAIGADDFIVLGLDDEGGTLWPIVGAGANGAACGPLLVSDALVSAALESGAIQIAGPRSLGELPRNGPLASVPLMAWPHTVGALVVFTLAAHRSILRPTDVALLELLSAHAAAALQIADLRSADSRRPPSLL